MTAVHKPSSFIPFIDATAEGSPVISVECDGDTVATEEKLKFCLFHKSQNLFLTKQFSCIVQKVKKRRRREPIIVNLEKVHEVSLHNFSGWTGSDVTFLE